MKKFAILGALMFLGTAAFAGAAVVPVDPPEEMSSSSDSDLTGAIVLLALVGMVVASSSLTGRAKAEKDPYLLSDTEEN